MDLCSHHNQAKTKIGTKLMFYLFIYFLGGGYKISFLMQNGASRCIPSSVLGGFGMTLVGRHTL